jgi:transcriptional regulator with XRE-family HTH domain
MWRRADTMTFMPRKANKPAGDFGERLATARKARGLTQVQLAQAIGSTQRAISYYENNGGYPPTPVAVELARALGISTEELMGLQPIGQSGQSPETQRLWKKFQQLLALPEKDRRAVIRLVNSLVTSKQASAE